MMAGNGNIRIFPHMAIAFPGERIFLRLGGNIHKTPAAAFSTSGSALIAAQAFDLCRPQGRYTVQKFRFIDAESIETAGYGRLVLGKDFTTTLAGTDFIWIGAVTIGSGLTTAREEQSSVAAQAVYDAVGSECADAAMETLHRISAQELRRQGLLISGKRFSPGYGDMPLVLQKDIFSLLHLAEMDITITGNCFMIPEKSVTAFAAVTSLQRDIDTI